MKNKELEKILQLLTLKNKHYLGAEGLIERFLKCTGSRKRHVHNWIRTEGKWYPCEFSQVSLFILFYFLLFILLSNISILASISSYLPTSPHIPHIFPDLLNIYFSSGKNRPSKVIN